MPATGLLTDHYELTMLNAALRDGTAHRECVFEVFSRHLPPGRRYGVVAGTGRVVDAVTSFGFDGAALDFLRAGRVVDGPTLDWLAGYRFSGDIDGYAEGELYFPGSPVLTVRADFATAVVLETLVLSILNHDSAVASAASRMVVAAGDRPCVEMGSRRTHEESAVAAARAAYLAGFAATSNLEAGRRHGIPTTGTSAHAFTLLHDDESAAFRAQVDTLGAGTTLLVDTYDVAAGIRAAVEAAGPALGAIRLDSGDLAATARQARAQLDALGAHDTRIVVTSDLDEFAIAALAAAPVDGYGVGTSVVTGSGAPTAGFVYKLVERDGVPVAKRSVGKPSTGGGKSAIRRHDAEGTMTAEVIRVGPAQRPAPGDRTLSVPLIRSGTPVPDLPVLEAAREFHRAMIASLPPRGRTPSRGEAVIETLHEEAG
ncbi:MAG: nicotinate phosphoribosyltransferase [Geodermatophilaceae bacterium]